MPGKSYDILVVGAGPAGMAAAWSAAQAGVRVGVIDDNPVPGGQIWRGERKKPSTREAATWMERIRRTDFEFQSNFSFFFMLE